MRIAECVYNTSRGPPNAAENPQSLHDDTESSTDTLLGAEDATAMDAAESSVLNKVADALARLGRVKRVGLGVKDKIGFINAWSRQRR